MPMPLWWGKVNKKVFNPSALRSGKWMVLTHVGRKSGTTYRTPLGAFEINGGYMFILVYGSRSDWVQNVLASGSASLETGERRVELTSPRIIDGDTARGMLPDDAKLPPKFLNVDEFLQMDVSAQAPVTASS